MTKEEKMEAIAKIMAEPEEAPKVEPALVEEPKEDPEIVALKTKVADLEKQVKDGMLGVSSTNAQDPEKSNFEEAFKVEHKN